MKFISSASIVFKSGKGGDGIIAWRRESKVRLGGPDGGNGGDGGSIYVEADENLNSLFHLRHHKFLQAKNGENGRNKSQHGKFGEDLVVKVPCGTNVFDARENKKIAELITHGERKLICKGGKGGRGNAFFKSSYNSAPYMYELGDKSEEIEVLFDLETISDIGLLGKPNAGKSSLLSAVSNAKPKVASFPFTTLIPVLGTVFFGERKLIFADIPGLIENASQGCGLGFEFLKHLNRCRILVHLVDSSEENVVESIRSIEQEIRNYSEELYSKPRLLVLNKIDLLEPDFLEKLVSEVTKEHARPIPVSILEGKNIDILLQEIFDLFQKYKFPQQEKEDYLEISDDPNLFSEISISNRDGIWYVDHPYLSYWIYKIPRDTHDNISRLLKKVKNFGVDKALLKAGAKSEDKIYLCDWNYDFFDV